MDTIPYRQRQTNRATHIYRGTKSPSKQTHTAGMETRVSRGQRDSPRD
jgi:hypothetical protein